MKPELLNFTEVIADAPQSIESSALQNTFYSKNEFIYIYIYIYIIIFFPGSQGKYRAREASKVKKER